MCMGYAHLMTSAVQRWTRGPEPTQGVDGTGSRACQASDRSATAAQTLPASSLEGHPDGCPGRSAWTVSKSLCAHTAYAIDQKYVMTRKEEVMAQVSRQVQIHLSLARRGRVSPFQDGDAVL